MYVEVAIDFSDQDRLRTYTYSVPAHQSVQPGDLLWVPFGHRPIQGIAMSVSETTDVANVRDIDSVVEGGPFISPHLLKTGMWIAAHYRTDIFRACALMLPPGSNQQLRIWVARGELADRIDDLLSGVSVTAEQRAVLDELPPQGRVRRDRVVRKIGRGNERHLDALVRAGVAVEESIWDLPRVKPVYKSHIKLSADINLADAMEDYRRRRTTKRAELLTRVANSPTPLPRADLTKEFGAHMVKAVLDDSTVSVEQVRVERDPLADYAVQDAIEHDLMDEQRDAVEAISAAIDAFGTHSTGTGQRQGEVARKFLLHGVTGSGKTEVYLRAVAQCIAAGRRAIVMVPEIAMTPQTLQRFASRFPGMIALQHSGLTMGQRFDQWHQISAGRYKVVIGSRSSIFAPVEDLGLVVIDEEHEWTFKQSDLAPRYHARDVAEKLCEKTGAVLVLGSATPDLGTFNRASSQCDRNGISLLRLQHRINELTRTQSDATNRDTSSQIVDMRDEIRAGHREMLSRPLLQALLENVERGEKSILFINRRGSASFVQCISCGTIRNCPYCQTPLVLHRNPRSGRGSRLQCHYCSYSVGASRQCRECGGTGMSRRAAGTEGLEETVRGFFPTTPILRWDSDTARNAADHTKMLDQFQSEGNHILIGTQMVAKGLDIPSVSLVGVVAADIGLAVPSFRSSERSFQILSQVTGRAGRADTPGVTIIQTFQPHHFAIVAAASQDFEGFYSQEIGTRYDNCLPPFTNYVRIAYSAYENTEAELEARSVRTRLNDYLEKNEIADVSIAGPTPAFPARRAGRYRWQILIKGDNPASILDHVQLGPGWIVDVDPVEMN